MSISEQIQKDLHWIATIIVATFAIAAMFYGLSTRITVLESQYMAINDQAASLKNIDQRLSRIEGRLGINTVSVK